MRVPDDREPERTGVVREEWEVRFCLFVEEDVDPDDEEAEVEKVERREVFTFDPCPVKPSPESGIKRLGPSYPDMSRAVKEKHGHDSVVFDCKFVREVG